MMFVTYTKTQPAKEDLSWQTWETDFRWGWSQCKELLTVYEESMGVIGEEYKRVILSYAKTVGTWEFILGAYQMALKKCDIHEIEELAERYY